jgi:hypothetical protein
MYSSYAEQLCSDNCIESVNFYIISVIFCKATLLTQNARDQFRWQFMTEAK